MAYSSVVERLTVNQDVAGSIPAMPVKQSKHGVEWCTCDRCGAEINENERSMFLKKVYRISGLLVRKYAYEKLNAFDLCPKCRKDFERFMKNE